MPEHDGLRDGEHTMSNEAGSLKKINLSRNEIGLLSIGECYYFDERADSWQRADVAHWTDLPVLILSPLSSGVRIEAWVRPTAFEYREPAAPLWRKLESNGTVYMVHQARIEGDTLYFSPMDRFLKSGYCQLGPLTNVYVVKEHIVERPWFWSGFRRRYRVVVEVNGKRYVVMRGLLFGMAHAFKRFLAYEGWYAG